MEQTVHGLDIVSIPLLFSCCQTEHHDRVDTVTCCVWDPGVGPCVASACDVEGCEEAWGVAGEYSCGGAVSRGEVMVQEGKVAVVFCQCDRLCFVLCYFVLCSSYFSL